MVMVCHGLILHGLRRLAALFFCGLLALAPLGASAAAVGWRSVAFFYGDDIPWESLGAFDALVVDPNHVDSAAWTQRLNPATQVVAYVALGEVQPSRPYFRDIPSAWLVGENPHWKSRIVDQSAPDWPSFWVERVVEPLWQRGFRHFFLDTLDTYQLVARTPEEKSAQEAGMIRAVRLLKQRHPEAVLLFNRGFEILPQLHADVGAVVVESLYQGWNAASATYQPVAEADRQWLLGQIQRIRDEWKLPVVVIDYAAPEQRGLARELARRIMADGLVPYVSVPALDGVGVGPFDVAPREVLALHDVGGGWDAIALSEIHRLGEMPFNYWGLSHRYVSLTDEAAMQRVARQPLAGRYAAVLVGVRGYDASWLNQLERVVRAARAQGVPLVFMGALPGRLEWVAWGLGGWSPGNQPPPQPWGWFRAAGHRAFEMDPGMPKTWPGQWRAPAGSQTWLRLGASGINADLVAITPWGGYAWKESAVRVLPSDRGERWTIDPIEFVAAALRLPADWPVPEVTTAGGRRLTLIHHDGDGFANRAELPGTPISAEVMLEQFLRRYRLPTTISFIEAEVSPQGLFAAYAPTLMETARKIAALPHVQIATHTYSHPFFWGAVDRGENVDRGYGVSLRLPGYTFDANREIKGSADFIEREIAPAGKRVRMIQWSGDCDPLEPHLALASQAGLLNMNGGITWPTRKENTLTLVSPHAMRKGDWVQVYAPMQNENVYTNLWRGPVYGFTNLLQTIELTDSPRRLKPVNLYYHTYLYSKPAGIASARLLYDWLEREHAAGRLTFIHAADFAQRVLDARRSTAARLLDASGWELRSAGALRQWRQSSAVGTPRIGLETGVIGELVKGDVRYVHLAAPIARIVPDPVLAAPALVSANAEVRSMQQLAPDHTRAVFDALLPLQSLWRLPRDCRVEVAEPLTATRQPDGLWSVRDARHPVNQSHDKPQQHAVNFRCAR